MNNSEGQTQEPVGGMLEIVKEICSDFMFENSNRISGYKAVRNLFDDWFSNNPYWQKKLSIPPPEPIKTEGEDEINLLKETINNQHALILSAEQRGYEKAKQELSAPPAPVEALAKEYAPDFSFAAEIKRDAFKAGYAAYLPQSSTEEEKDDDEGWIYCPNCGRVKAEQ